MSITYCHNCNKNIDEDIDVSHIEDCKLGDNLEHIKLKYYLWCTQNGMIHLIKTLLFPRKMKDKFLATMETNK